MTPFFDIVSKFERSFSCCGKNFRQFIDPKKGLTQLLNNLKRTEAENSLEQVSFFMKKLPKTPGGIVPVRSLQEMENFVAKEALGTVQEFPPNDSVTRYLKLRCLNFIENCNFYNSKIQL